MNHPDDFLQGANASFIDEMYARFQADPASVPADWALFFTGVEVGSRREGASEPAGAQARGGVHGLVYAYREHGHLIADLDPLGDAPLPRHPYLTPEALGLDAANLDRPV